MTDPTPPRAPDAMPEAVRAAIRLFEDATVQRAEVIFSQPPTKTQQDKYVRAFRASRDADSMLEYEILTALREATDTRDQEIARLTAELAAAQADTARLDWLIGAQDGCTRASYRFTRVYDRWNGEDDFRAAIDAARAAGERQG